jgi:acyl-CoA dehydrogenase
MDFTQTAEVALVIETVRDYVNNTLLPQEMAVEHAARIPDTVQREMGDLGFFGLPFSEEDGGIGVPFTAYAQAMEQLGRANAAYGVQMASSSGLVGQALALGGDNSQRTRWLAPLVSGATLGAFALTEESSSSEGRGLRTRATPDDDGYRLDGTKHWVINGPDAGIFLIFARLPGDEGTGVFVVERDTPGLSVGPRHDQLGFHSVGFNDLHLEGCRVSAATRLTGGPGGEDAGLALAEVAMLRYGVILGALAVGTATRLIEAARDFATQRKQFGQPIGAFGAVQNMIADMATEAFVAQQAVYRAAWEIETGHSDPTPARQAKLYATEAVYRIADRAMQVHGGMGFMKELWIERGYRDARMFRLLGPSSEDLRPRIAQALGCPTQ